MPKWKNVVAEIDQLESRLKAETPPTGVHYYKNKSGEIESQSAKEIQNRVIVETSDKSKVKIRFSDLPVSKMT